MFLALQPAHDFSVGLNRAIARLLQRVEEIAVVHDEAAKGGHLDTGHGAMSARR